MKISCRFCDGVEGAPLYSTYTVEGDNFDLVRCTKCDVVALWPPPSADQLSSAYGDHYYGPDKSKFASPVEAVVDRFRRGRARRLSRRLGRAGKALDIGCGNGRFLSFLKSEGFEIFGTELPGRAFERARKIPGIHISQGDLDPTQHEPLSFDLVTMWHVFEHLSQPKELLQHVSSLVRRGGLVSLSVPNFESWQSKVFKGSWFHLDPPRHLFFIGPDEMKRELAEVGFKLVSVSHFSLEQNPFGVLQSLLNVCTDSRDSLYEYLKFWGNRGQNHKYGARLSFFGQLAFGVLTLPVTLTFSAIEAIAKRGGTVEYVFEKTG